MLGSFRWSIGRRLNAVHRRLLQLLLLRLHRAHRTIVVRAQLTFVHRAGCISESQRRFLVRSGCIDVRIVTRTSGQRVRRPIRVHVIVQCIRGGGRHRRGSDARCDIAAFIQCVRIAELLRYGRHAWRLSLLQMRCLIDASAVASAMPKRCALVGIAK